MKKNLKNIFRNKKVIITGGTGSLGRELTNIFLKNFNLKRLVIFSRDELKQSEMIKKYQHQDKREILRFFLGDVRDLSRMKFAMRDVDYVIHAAALKHVDLAEYNPLEYINTNIIGAKNVIEAAFSCNVEKVIALSTDKAANPINLYGATKLASDKLFVSANNISGNQKTRFAVVRYGNVANSRGSVLPYFLKLHQNNSKNFPVTDKRMTRFWITLSQSAELVLNSFYRMRGGEIFVPKIPSYRIMDVAKAIDPKIKTKVIGIRPGEKLHEEMITLSDSYRTLEFKNHFVILPSTKLWDEEKYRAKNKKDIGIFNKKAFSYNSQNNKWFLSVQEIQNLIKSHVKK